MILALGCAASRPTANSATDSPKIRALKPSEISSAVLTASLAKSDASGVRRPKKVKDCFDLSEEVILYVNVSWDWTSEEFTIQPEVR
ncbi:MAG: hypothetical protein ACX98W_10650, partial [bacterium]